MIDLCRPSQRTFGEGLIAEETASLWEPWMRHADQVLEDEQLVKAVHEALLKRRPKSRTRGRRGYAAEIVLRMLGGERGGGCAAGWPFLDSSIIVKHISKQNTRQMFEKLLSL